MHHHFHSDKMGSVLRWSLVITILFVLIEALAGIQARSLALLSDAGHNFTDALALMLAWVGIYFGKKPPDESKTYGYQRAGVLAAFINALSLMVLAGFILYESYHRWFDPEPVNEITMIVIAGLGLVVNGAIMWGLHSERGHDLNIRSAWAHMLGDALGSVGIIAGAIVIRFTGWDRTDSVLSALIGLLIIWTGWDIIHESLNILLEGLPRGLKLQSVVGAIQHVEGVIDVHDLHIWSLGSQTHALSCHVLIEDVPPSESNLILRRINSTLDTRFGIRHTTVQFEHAICKGCSIPESGSPAPHAHHHD